MLKESCNLNIGNWSVNSADDPNNEFIGLEILLSLDLSSDSCDISVYAESRNQPDLAEGMTVGTTGTSGLGKTSGKSFSIQVRWSNIKAGDPITIQLTSGEVSDTVMTAEVQSIKSSFGQTVIEGRTGMQKLAGARLNQVYENQSLNQIVSDLASQIGIEIGEIGTGSTYSYFVVHESRNVLQYIRELAMREGMDVYFDTQNKLNVKKFNKTSADHTFSFGVDILDLQLLNHQMSSEHIAVYGESPSSNQGTDTWHWIAKDLSPFQGESGQGVKTLALQDSAIRTKDAADTLAASRLGVIKAHSTRGRLKILGNPKVKLADAIQIKNAEKPELNGLFKVSSVRHVLNKQEGYVTYIGFTGLGGQGQRGF
jgi:hypothetical protein